jgi:hypothetical protein
MSSSSSEFTLVGVSLVFIFIFLLMVLYILYQNVNPNTFYLVCGPNECATNFTTGEKRCSVDSTPVIYDPKIEVCNQKFFCNNEKTPFPLFADGSTGPGNSCQGMYPCTCLPQAQCSSQMVVSFSVAREGTNPNNYILNQNYTDTPGVPIKIGDSNEYCNIRANFFDRITPRTSECQYATVGQPTFNELQACLYSNPCTLGRAVLIPSSFPPINIQTNGGNYLAGCVVSNEQSCTSSQIPVWDEGTLKVICLTL